MATWWDERVLKIQETNLNQQNHLEKKKGKGSGGVGGTSAGTSGGRPKAEIPTKSDPNDPLKDQYGDLGLIQSTEITKRIWTPINSINSTLDGQ